MSASPELAFEARLAFDQRAFRDALGAFATGVTVITTLTDGGALVGMTANSFGSVSLDPPLVSFCVRKAAFSLPAFARAARLAVNVLGVAQVELSNRFALPSAERWNGVAHELTDMGCVLIKGGLASFECAPHATVDGGDHLVFLGRVLRFRHAAGAPLLYWRGAYHGLAALPSDLVASFDDRAVPPPLTCFDPWFAG